MKCEDVKADGDNTLLRIEFDGNWRRIIVTREAIEDHLRASPEVAAAMTADDRCDYVRKNLPYVFAAIRRKLRGTTGAAERMTIKAGEL